MMVENAKHLVNLLPLIITNFSLKPEFTELESKQQIQKPALTPTFSVTHTMQTNTLLDYPFEAWMYKGKETIFMPCFIFNAIVICNLHPL